MGILHHSKEKNNKNAIELLQNHLSQYYNPQHEVILYEAAQYPGFEPRVEKLPLNHLSRATFSGISTLYVPPVSKKTCDMKMLEKLNINIIDLQ